jgi:transcription elongation GreA/GreB family factor
MSTKYYTKKGLDLKERKIKAQEAKVRAIGKEAGDEAGLNCDWHDNFGYEDAKRRLEMESALLAKLREEISGSRVIEVEEQNERIGIGVTVKFALNGDEKEITVGAFGESDPTNGLVSYTSPLGRVLLRMEAGDSKIADIAGRKTEIEILEIRPPSHLYHRLIDALSDAQSSEQRLEEADNRPRL